eukprot:8797657-Pyramimonas_sp.AAC.1
MSESAIPFVVGCQAVLDVPWRPHLGLIITLKSSGKQLITRRLDAPGRLPQLRRPRALPQEGSKTSKAKKVKAVRAALAQERRSDFFHTLFSEYISQPGDEISTA